MNINVLSIGVGLGDSRMPFLNKHIVVFMPSQDQINVLITFGNFLIHLYIDMGKTNDDLCAQLLEGINPVLGLLKHVRIKHIRFGITRNSHAKKSNIKGLTIIIGNRK